MTFEKDSIIKIYDRDVPCYMLTGKRVIEIEWLQVMEIYRTVFIEHISLLPVLTIDEQHLFKSRIEQNANEKNFSVHKEPLENGIYDKTIILKPKGYK